MLAGNAAVSAYAYGFCMNMWFWPFSPAADTQLLYPRRAPAGQPPPPCPLHRDHLVAGLGHRSRHYRTVAVAVLGTAVLTTLRRASRRAAFDVPVEFADANEPHHPHGIAIPSADE
jgi:energy-coupling factor transport system substrate-specific component